MLWFLTPIFVWAALYQVLGNIRHMFWDFGIGIGIREVRLSGYAMIALSLVGAGGISWLLI